ncbi:F-actin-capping protein subunit alpha, partial [Thamnocephalis sphaerospora]
EKIKIASGFLLSSPPGEINDVFTDLTTLIGDDDDALRAGVLDALKQYTSEQFSTVKLPGQSHQTIICEAAHIDDNRYIDPRANKTFAFDYMHQVTADVRTIEIACANIQPIHRAAIDDAVKVYVDAHYPGGASAVFLRKKLVTVAIVGNKYNPSNFWNGRWRSLWTFSLGTNELNGNIKANVHYYEDGNVQLDASKSVQATVADASVSLPSPDDAAAAIVKAVKAAEGAYQRALNESYTRLSETTFKSLRRALPMTHKKLDWDNV